MMFELSANLTDIHSKYLSRLKNLRTVRLIVGIDTAPYTTNPDLYKPWGRDIFVAAMDALYQRGKETNLVPVEELFVIGICLMRMFLCSDTRRNFVQ
jgi:hypothetical protein